MPIEVIYKEGRPWSCGYDGCDFTGTAFGLLDHTKKTHSKQEVKDEH